VTSKTSYSLSKHSNPASLAGNFTLTTLLSNVDAKTLIEIRNVVARDAGNNSVPKIATSALCFRLCTLVNMFAMLRGHYCWDHRSQAHFPLHAHLSNVRHDFKVKFVMHFRSYYSIEIFVSRDIDKLKFVTVICYL
jgi:hypothetical protein